MQMECEQRYIVAFNYTIDRTIIIDIIRPNILKRCVYLLLLPIHILYIRILREYFVYGF